MSVVLKWLVESKTLLLFSMGVAIATIVLSLFLFQNIGFHHGGETITANSPHLPTSPFESDPVTSTVSELDWGACCVSGSGEDAGQIG